MEINWLEILGVFIGMAMLSYAFKPNPIHRLVESVFVGGTAGYLLITDFRFVYNMAVTPLSNNLILIIPLVLGILVYIRLSKKYSWISNYPIAFLTAVGIGVAVRTIAETDILQQIRTTAKPLFIPTNAITSFNNLVILISTVTVISYFLYARKPGKIFNFSSKIGVSFMMIGFGAAISNDLSSRISTTIGFLQTSIIVPSGIYMVPIMIILITISIFPEKVGLKKEKKE